ncbi:hypothetical protein C8R47DRAFT_1079221 [Mycena vitilis]|nr:hypothetical protein C8R47DRAFT_1079221 [Mycena vitilis]
MSGSVYISGLASWTQAPPSAKSTIGEDDSMDEDYLRTCHGLAPQWIEDDHSSAAASFYLGQVPEREGIHAGHRRRCFSLKISRQRWAILASAAPYVAYGLSTQPIWILLEADPKPMINLNSESTAPFSERTIEELDKYGINVVRGNRGRGTVISGQAAPNSKTADGGRVSPPNVFILSETRASLVGSHLGYVVATPTKVRERLSIAHLRDNGSGVFAVHQALSTPPPRISEEAHKNVGIIQGIPESQCRVFEQLVILGDPCWSFCLRVAYGRDILGADGVQ